MASLTDQQRNLASTLRQALAHATDEELDGFLSSYAIGTIAGFLVQHMNPAARRGFITSLRQQYPESFEPAS
jgi:hypothetical protein